MCLVCISTATFCMIRMNFLEQEFVLSLASPFPFVCVSAHEKWVTFASALAMIVPLSPETRVLMCVCAIWGVLFVLLSFQTNYLWLLARLSAEEGMMLSRTGSLWDLRCWCVLIFDLLWILCGFSVSEGYLGAFWGIVKLLVAVVVYLLTNQECRVDFSLSSLFSM